MVVQVIERIRAALHQTPYEGKVYLVGGIVRDELLNRPLPNDVDLVLEGDALQLAQYLYESGLTPHKPVLYRRFGTALLVIDGVQVELVSARAESYRSDSRKPVQVKPATLQEDALRRDFTINTLLKNLHTGEILDPLGCALQDLHARVLRTPRNPEQTLEEDPLRMMRGVRFAVQLRFTIDPPAWSAIQTWAARLKIVSMERIRDEWTRILQLPNAHEGIQMLLDSGLFAQFGQPLLPMVGCTQPGGYHLYDVWEHSLRAIACLQIPENCPMPDWELRLATLLHDVGKPATRTIDEQGVAHFYGHEAKGAEIAQEWLAALRYSNATIERVTRLIRLHMRPGAYTAEWSDSAVRRLIRDAGELLEPLLCMVAADICAQQNHGRDLTELRQRIQQVQSAQPPAQWKSPLSGKEIMLELGVPEGPLIGRIKQFLEEQVVEGNLSPNDKERARQLAQSFLQQHFYKSNTGDPLHTPDVIETNTLQH